MKVGCFYFVYKIPLVKLITMHFAPMATLMLHIGVNIRFIQEMLGYSNIGTTAKYYLGTDKKKLKEAYEKFLKFD